MNEVKEVALPMAALAAGPAQGLSERYAFVDTRAVVKAVVAEGWAVHSARAVVTRRGRDPLHARHMIEFRPSDAQLRVGNAEGVPRVMFTNSHDGTSSVQWRTGIYRYICSNGLVIGTDIAADRARHAASVTTGLLERIRGMARESVHLTQTIERWSGLQLTHAQRTEFAALTAELRWGDRGRAAPAELLAPRRASDDRGDLWATFNVLQENTVRGGLTGVARTGRRVMTQPITGFQRDMDYNAALWRLAAEVADAVE